MAGKWWRVAAKVHKHLIKCLSKIIKREKGVSEILAPRRRCLDYSKVYCHVTER